MNIITAYVSNWLPIYILGCSPTWLLLSGEQFHQSQKPPISKGGGKGNLKPVVPSAWAAKLNIKFD